MGGSGSPCIPSPPRRGPALCRMPGVSALAARQLPLVPVPARGVNKAVPSCRGQGRARGWGRSSGWGCWSLAVGAAVRAAPTVPRLAWPVGCRGRGGAGHAHDRRPLGRVRGEQCYDLPGSGPCVCGMCPCPMRTRACAGFPGVLPGLGRGCACCFVPGWRGPRVLPPRPVLGRGRLLTAVYASRLRAAGLWPASGRQAERSAGGRGGEPGPGAGVRLGVGLAPPLSAPCPWDSCLVPPPVSGACGCHVARPELPGGLVLRGAELLAAGSQLCGLDWGPQGLSSQGLALGRRWVRCQAARPGPGPGTPAPVGYRPCCADADVPGEGSGHSALSEWGALAGVPWLS